MKQRHVAALVAEALGVFALVLVILSVSRLGYPFFTAIGAGVTIAVMFSAFSKISGGHFNPAITISALAIKQVSPLRALGYVVAQVVAAFGALKVYEMLLDKKLPSSAGSFDWRVFTAEALGTLIFGAAVAAVITERLKGYQAAYTVGAGLFLGIVVSSLVSLGIDNPAAAVGLRAMDVNYIFGPIVGALVGFGLVAFVISPLVVKNSAVPSLAVKRVEVPKVAVQKSETKKPAVKKTVAKKPAKKSAKK